LTVFFGYCCDAYAETASKNHHELVPESNNTIAADDIPFADMPGYIKGGNSFGETIKDEHGKSFTLGDFRGKVVLVAFSTTWCGNCPEVLRSLDDLENKLRKEKINAVKIIPLNVGDEDIEAIKIHYKSNNVQLLDVYHSVSVEAMNGFKSVPLCIVFDIKGNPVWGYAGSGVDFCSDEFINYLKKLL
jgi:thiol-disulfide isomerase/thioredoxin